MNHSIDNRELATILAALRRWQEDQMPAAARKAVKYIEQGGEMPGVLGQLLNIASDGASLDPLTEAEVDALCERLRYRLRRPRLDHPEGEAEKSLNELNAARAAKGLPEVEATY